MANVDIGCHDAIDHVGFGAKRFDNLDKELIVIGGNLTLNGGQVLHYHLGILEQG